MKEELIHALQKNNLNFYNIVNFKNTIEKIITLDFSAENTALASIDIANTAAFSNYITNKLQSANAKFGIGGYNEDRVLYKHSKLFDGKDNRTVHLGIDIWGEEGTEVFAPLGGMVHGFAFNNNIGDYGATIILQHQLDTISFHTLYGHLALKDIEKIKVGQYISRGNLVGHFGSAQENGNWPPHLHFQIIEDLEYNEGDYPGVCAVKDSEKYLHNCPNPDLILGMLQYAK
ncbi:MAG: peptidoglycan DD-metalloendopeptidase family protein [Chitinophagaceae bacterium]|nr:peptidoglycan DD-metalloendopeptidase family protein [Chitinophagaceae bacterium]